MQLLVGRVRYNRRDEKWQAYLDYRDPDGKRHYKSRYFDTEEDARRGADQLVSENSELIAQKQKWVVGDESFVVAPSKPGEGRWDKSERVYKRIAHYTCPSCNQVVHGKNKRLIRFQSRSVTICRGCYRQGPVVVGQNLRENMEGLS